MLRGTSVILISAVGLALCTLIPVSVGQERMRPERGASLSGAASNSAAGQRTQVHIAGIQFEVPYETEVLAGLDGLLQKYPDTDLVVLSEYTFMDTLPKSLKDWCRKHQRYFIVGAEDPAPRNNYYNTAFVIGPSGDVVFRQAKAVPIQFFKDGLPALEQKLWDSPWGKLGICICYDLSYTRVTDRLVQLGAQALIVPTMDVKDWGRRQHELHARVAPVRAAEYGVPILRLASSGISQSVDRTGQVLATAQYDGEGEMIAGVLELRGPGSLPVDRWLAPFSTALAVLVILCLVIGRILDKRHSRPPGSGSAATEAFQAASAGQDSLIIT